MTVIGLVAFSLWTHLTTLWQADAQAALAYLFSALPLAAFDPDLLCIRTRALHVGLSLTLDRLLWQRIYMPTDSHSPR